MKLLKTIVLFLSTLASAQAFAANHPIVDKCIELGFTNPNLVKEKISGYQESVARHNKGWEGEISQKSYNVCLEFNGRNDKFHVHWKDINKGNTYQVYLDALAERNASIDAEIKTLRDDSAEHVAKHKELLEELKVAQAKRDEYLIVKRLYHQRFHLKSVIERGSLMAYGAVTDREEVVFYTTSDLPQGNYEAWAVRSVKPVQFVRTNGFTVEVYTFIEAKADSPMVKEYKALSKTAKAADDARYKYFVANLKNLDRNISKLKSRKSHTLRLK
ncbi:hypothetical protein L4D09_14410 [Photobacterium makurazakiensis]|uniref:hypothetical protein n=1 Tax=Photobacterium makurazakiensis TaxID=2910234 RepID=UPI003D104FAC